MLSPNVFDIVAAIGLYFPHFIKLPQNRGHKFEGLLNLIFGVEMGLCWRLLAKTMMKPTIL